MHTDPAAAIHRNLLWADRRVAGLGPRGTAENDGTWLLIDPGIPFPLFNMALLSANHVASPEVAVAQARRWFSARGLAPFRLVLRQERDAPLIEAAHAAGMVPAGEESPAMLLETRRVAAGNAPDGLAITAVEDEPALTLYTRQFSGDDPAWTNVTRRIGEVAIALHGFTLLLGTFDGVPVATSMAVVTGDTVGIYNVGVAPEFRHRGFGEAMSRAAIETGLAAGCLHAGLQASAMGLGLYHKMGFRKFDTYISLEAAG